MSSGAAYGSNFETPADANTKAVIDINHLQPQDWYGVAKLHAECRHRSLAHLPIVDIRVFNYFSHTQEIEARFLITDILRAIRDKTVLKTSSDYIVRDYLHPSDFYQLVSLVLAAPARNTAIDCYSKAPTDKPNLLMVMQEKFGLQYEIIKAQFGINATGNKPEYYSVNRLPEALGYQPTHTAIEGLLLESRKLLSQSDRASGVVS